MTDENGITDAFSLREGEWARVESIFDPGKHRYGIMLAAVPGLPVPRVEICNYGPNAGKPPAAQAVVACRFSPRGWNWLPLSLNTKEVLGALIETLNPVPRDCWLGLVITPEDERRVG